MHPMGPQLLIWTNHAPKDTHTLIMSNYAAPNAFTHAGRSCTFKYTSSLTLSKHVTLKTHPNRPWQVVHLKDPTHYLAMSYTFKVTH